MIDLLLLGALLYSDSLWGDPFPMKPSEDVVFTARIEYVQMFSDEHIRSLAEADVVERGPIRTFLALRVERSLVGDLKRGAGILLGVVLTTDSRGSVTFAPNERYLDSKVWRKGRLVLVAGRALRGPMNPQAGDYCGPIDFKPMPIDEEIDINEAVRRGQFTDVELDRYKSYQLVCAEITTVFLVDE